MPISNKSSENRMTTTTIRLNSSESQQKQLNRNSQNVKLTSNNTDNHLKLPETYSFKRPMESSQTYRTYSTTENTQLNFQPSSPTASRNSPRIIRVKRVAKPKQDLPTTTNPSEQKVTTHTVVVKDTTSRGTTPPPASFYGSFLNRQHVLNPTTYQIETQPKPILARDVIVHQQTQPGTTTTTKSSTRMIDATTLPTLGEDSFIEETKTTTTIIKPIEIPTIPAVATSTITTVPQITTTTVVPPVESTTTTTTTAAVVPTVQTTTIREEPIRRTHRRRRIRTRSISTYSDTSTTSYTTTTTSSYTSSTTTIPERHIVQHHSILPPRPPIQTTIINDPPTTIVPQQRYIHRARRLRTYSGYYSSDLDFGKRKIYKSDYKYRHYYCCNLCKGRCDLLNSSCSCCEWFYGCPLWALILLGLLLLALIVTFFTLFALQPTINSSRYSETAQTQLLNRTQIVYGFLQNCGYQTGTPTTLVLCSNTQTTSTSRIELSSYYITSKFVRHKNHKLLFIFILFILTFIE